MYLWWWIFLSNISWSSRRVDCCAIALANIKKSKKDSIESKRATLPRDAGKRGKNEKIYSKKKIHSLDSEFTWTTLNDLRSPCLTTELSTARCYSRAAKEKNHARSRPRFTFVIIHLPKKIYHTQMLYQRLFAIFFFVAIFKSPYTPSFYDFRWHSWC